MCGIVGYVGKKKALPILIDGLKSLEYRGYDSSGISYILDNKTYIIKEEGKLENLINKLNTDIDTYIGIGHTRWATHGNPTKENAHPHKQGKITLVHNGIIENYEEIKTKLNYDFKSETDSEVIAALLDSLYNKNNDILKSLIELKSILKGSYSLGIIVDNIEKIYAIKKDSPLIIASNKELNFIASDVPAVLKYTNKYVLLNENEIACLDKDSIVIYDEDLNQVNKDYLIFEGDSNNACKNGFEHFMLKEIYEQPDVFKKTIDYLFNIKLPNFKKYNKIEIVACGSAYHAGLIGKNLMEKFANIEVNVYIASEYRYQKIFHNKKTLVIFISQSGETADTIACLNKVKEEKLDSLGIINVVGSSIARNTTKVIYTKAGIEIAVATTKAFLSQITVLSLIAFKLANFNDKETKDILNDVERLPNLMEKLLDINYKKIANELYQKEHIYFLGRGIDYCLSLEGSLKLKEISYIHSEAYPSGELKHGTIALISKDTPLIVISTDKKLNDKTLNNVKEVKARGAKVYGISTFISNEYDELILVDSVHEILRPILTIIPLQMIAYEVAKLKGCEIDKPRNLAKSVTVE